jgi:hypothetical protein
MDGEKGVIWQLCSTKDSRWIKRRLGSRSRVLDWEAGKNGKHISCTTSDKDAVLPKITSKTHFHEFKHFPAWGLPWFLKGSPKLDHSLVVIRETSGFNCCSLSSFSTLFLWKNISLLQLNIDEKKKPHFRLLKVLTIKKL